MLDKINLPISEITTEILRNYLANYKNNSNAGMVTIDNIRRTLSSFFTWLENEDYIVKSPVRRIHKVKATKKVKETLTDENLEKLRDVCTNVRDLAILELLISTGMRVGELTRLNISDMNFQERSCIVLGKGNSEREVYFSAKSKMYVEKYLSVTLNKIYDFLCAGEITRHDIIIALGGGVTGDMAGFAAATYLRGIDFVQIPTTLLAQIDSSVGGKTAIDISGGKNLVGAFKQPLLVICDTNTLGTLSPEIFSDGMAEAIKYGMIKDKALFEQIASRNYNTISDIIDELVYKCIDIKRQVVENDEFENGERMILNFGHTIGHAVECYYNYEKYTHGCGVAVGMCYITSKCCCDEVFRRLEACVRAYNLPTAVSADISQLLPYCSKDKKRAGSNISYIVCPEIGKAEIRRASVKEFDELMEG